jgi:hypothetical protein
MPKSKDRDFFVNARQIVEQAIGEHLDGTPLEKTIDQRNPRAVAAGRLGGEKGGSARAAKLSSAQRSAIARKAARARWAIKGKS